MGGGSGGGRKSLGDTSELEKKAKDELEKGERINTFLSFDYDDIDDVNLLRAHAKNDNSEIEFIDRSVREPFDSDKAEYLKKKISDRINQSSQTIVYVSDTTCNSKWVNWEIEKSIEFGKKVIAVHKGDKAPKVLPDAIKKNKIKVVPWSKLADVL